MRSKLEARRRTVDQETESGQPEVNSSPKGKGKIKLTLVWFNFVVGLDLPNFKPRQKGKHQMKKDFVLCLYLYLYLTYISLSIILFSSSFSFLFGFFSVFVYVYFWLTLTFYAFKYFVGTVFQFFLFSSCVIYSPIYATIMSCQPLKGLSTPKRTKHPDFFLCLPHEKPVKKCNTSPN